MVADDASVWKLDTGRIAKKHTEGDKWTWAGGATTKGDEGACKYFSQVADMKKKANVKDMSARLAGDKLKCEIKGTYNRPIALSACILHEP